MSTEKESVPRRRARHRPSAPASPAPAASAPIEDWLAYVQTKVESVKFGSLQIVVHDGRITQVESTEKFRLPPPPPQAAP
ncbi:MAG: YezD family protein [Verrucomicrobia bacterium]|nr:YezD family protein [Verrucomicrobiota bacterium]